MITVTMNQVTQENDIGLGNHMFQYALCRLLAEKRGFNYYIPYNEYLKRCFPDLESGTADGETQYQFAEDQSQVFRPEIFTFPDFTHLHGFFQTEKYFEGHEEQVKGYFNVDMTDECRDLLQKYPVDKYCFMHVRASGNKNGEARYLLPNDYYHRAMEKIKELSTDISFVIVTDDFEFSSVNFPGIDVLSNSVSTDFRLIYFSKWAVISNSTFPWWAAWLSHKNITIAPENWLNYKFPDAGFYPVDIKSKKFTYIV